MARQIVLQLKTMTRVRTGGAQNGTRWDKGGPGTVRRRLASDPLGCGLPEFHQEMHYFAQGARGPRMANASKKSLVSMDLVAPEAQAHNKGAATPSGPSNRPRSVKPLGKGAYLSPRASRFRPGRRHGRPRLQSRGIGNRAQRRGGLRDGVTSVWSLFPGPFLLYCVVLSSVYLVVRT